jgi:hypothetical protein
MTTEELRKLRAIQAVMVRNYVDTKKLDIQVIGTSVYIEGVFSVYEWTSSHKPKDRIERELSAKRTLMFVERQIRSMSDITHIELKLHNWELRDGQWILKGDKA